jgi:hypothetical protein
MKSNGWNLVSQCDMANAGGAWVNANGTDGTVLSKGILAGDLMASPSASSTTASATPRFVLLFFLKKRLNNLTVFF